MGLKIIEVFGIVSSYIFLLLALKRLMKNRLDLISILILFFCSYILLSYFWGSPLRELARLALPFSVFFFAKSDIDDLQIKKVLFLMILGFILPVLLSTLSIFTGFGLWRTMYWTGMDRFKGIYSAPHGLAHNMLICMVVIFIYIELIKRDSMFNKKQILFYTSMLILCVFNIYKSYTRTAYIGLTIVILFFLWGHRSYFTLVIGSVSVLLVSLFSGLFQKIFFDVYEPLQGAREIGSMGSGRIGGWTSIMQHFFGLPVVDQIKGEGISLFATITHGALFGGSHNDFLSVLTCFGYIGFFLYLSIYCALVTRALTGILQREIKFTFFGFIFAVGAMNILSNSYLSRFELGQYFWILMGFLYCFTINNIYIFRRRVQTNSLVDSSSIP